MSIKEKILNFIDEHDIDVIWYRIKHKYHDLCDWLHNFFTKEHLALVKYVLFKDRWYDAEYLLELEYHKVKEMLAWHEGTMRFVDSDQIVRQLKLAVSLLEIISGRKELEDIYIIPHNGEPENHKNVTIVPKMYVNVRNAKRFVPEGCSDPEGYVHMFNRYPAELYRIKAQHLYYRLRKECTDKWSD